MAREVASGVGLVLAAIFAVTAPRAGRAQSASEPRPATPASVAGRIVASANRGAFEPCGTALSLRPVIDSAAGTGTNLRAAELQVRGRTADRIHPEADAVLLVTRGWGHVTAGRDTGRLGPGSVVHVPAGLRFALASVAPRAAPLELLLTLRPLENAAPLSDRTMFGCASSSVAGAPLARPSGGLLVIDPTMGERITYCVFPLTITAQVDSDAAPGARLTAAMGALRQGTEGAVHRGDDELVFVTHGTGRAFVGSDTGAVTPGSAVFAPRGLRHGFINEGRGTLEYFIVFSEPGPRELFHRFAARPGPFCASGPAVPSEAGGAR